jgi:hypothetical protein
MIIDGDLEFVMDDGIIVLSKSIFPDVTTDEHEDQFYYDSHIVAITPEGNTIFETEIPGIISKVALMEEQLLVEYRQDVGMLVSYFSDEYNNLLINMNGDITYEFSEVYPDSKYILQYTDVYCFIASSTDELRSANYDIFLETDVDGNMINSYQLLMNSFNKYIYYTGTEIKIFDHVILLLY